MKKENIIKALECCIEDECENCPYDEQTACREYLLHGALALIKEQDEQIFQLENRLKECENGYAGTLHLESNKLHDAEKRVKELTEESEKLTINMNAYGLTAKRLAEENERLKAEVSVKKKLLDKCVDLEDRVKADTVREFTEKLKKECLVDSGYEVLQIGTIDRIAEEMLGKECTSCKHFVGCECFDGKVCDLYEKK